ncbi:P-loop NTPase family protein [Paraburkholderia saeva]|uniref:ABC transporter domain-containing protein n=1 Tax=Paraburkholderia saeva TaxID=2777537 RepID=A0A9N8RSV3_9BURK|nr:hypothetical protein [Paraburkholderia saeva]CAG4886937.1 hypothetical protein R70241_00293 [Paraburkholderia saeva]CAG4887052.1 hypothetical protein LMG31841_00325 [Paraburkholderia saeva]
MSYHADGTFAVHACRALRQAPVRLALNALTTCDGALVNVSLRVKAGEIVGIAGAPGSGQRALADACLGLRAVEGGSIRSERPVRAIQDAAAAGITGEPSGIYIVDESTVCGEGVSARAARHRRLRKLAEQGAAILLISPDLDALMALSHRLPVMREGRLVAEFERPDFHEPSILEYFSH